VNEMVADSSFLGRLIFGPILGEFNSHVYALKSGIDIMTGGKLARSVLTSVL